jgi:hypothetical protein
MANLRKTERSDLTSNYYLQYFFRLILKYKNKIKELESNQKLELNNFQKIQKGIASKINIFYHSLGPNNRIINIIKSAANIKLNSNLSDFNRKEAFDN